VRWIAVCVAALSAHSAVNAWLLRVPAVEDAPDQGTRASVLLPLRDEAHRVEPCLKALLRNDFHELLVLDDGSSDGTADVVRRVVRGDPRVRLLTGRELPPGWLGKPHACQQLADAATGDRLVFVDADVVLVPKAVAATVRLLDELDLVSPYPRQEAAGLTRLVQPLLQWSWLTFLPLRLAETSRRPSFAAANGQLLAVRRSSYDRAGGHAAVRAEVVEDVALLRAMKAAGGTGGVVDGTAIATTRMYDSWPELVAGYTKSAWTVPIPAVGLLSVLYVLPAIAALRGSRAGLAAYAAGVSGRVITGRRTGGRVWPDALAHPVSVGVLCWLTGRSHVARRHGAVTWKGRSL
jgi:hypothetical protein